jgi:hypothetical protein
MPNQHCIQCNKMERCSKYVDDSSKAVKPFLVDLCRTCAKALGFRLAKALRPSAKGSSKKMSRVSGKRSRRRSATR